MKKTIGILGGMGPLATADLMIKIVTETKADCDNEHIRVYVDSNTAIPDRTAAILYGGADPMPEMTDALRHLEACGADCILLPCNSAHYFYPRLQALTDTPILNMPAIAVERCIERYPGQKAAVLGTKGALATGVYARVLEEKGIAYLIPDEAEQDVLMHLIYEVVKASKPLTPEAETWRGLLDGLRAKGADYFILGCTELPIVANTLEEPGPFVDPTTELARAAVLFCGYEAKN